jgi:hypothetical protein
MVDVLFVAVDGMIDGTIDDSIDRRAEKAYRRQGASKKEAKQLVFEDEFFKDVGGRPGTPARAAGDLDWRKTYPEQ